MSLKTGLIDRSGHVVAFLHMFRQLLVGEQIVLVRKHFLVASTEITHLLVVDRSHVAMEIRPVQSGKVARVVRAVISEQKNSITNNVFIGILDADLVVGATKIPRSVFAESFRCIVGKDDKWRLSLPAKVASQQELNERGSGSRKTGGITYPAVWTVLVLV